MTPTFVHEKPHKHSVVVCGKAVNMTAMARSIGIDNTYLSRILAGKRRPSVDVFIHIAESIGVDVYELLRDIAARKRAA